MEGSLSFSFQLNVKISVLLAANIWSSPAGLRSARYPVINMLCDSGPYTFFNTDYTKFKAVIVQSLNLKSWAQNPQEQQDAVCLICEWKSAFFQHRWLRNTHTPVMLAVITILSLNAG